MHPIWCVSFFGIFLFVVSKELFPLLLFAYALNRLAPVVRASSGTTKVHIPSPDFRELLLLASPRASLWMPWVPAIRGTVTNRCANFEQKKGFCRSLLGRL